MIGGIKQVTNCSQKVGPTVVLHETHNKSTGVSQFTPFNDQIGGQGANSQLNRHRFVQNVSCQPLILGWKVAD